MSDSRMMLPQNRHAERAVLGGVLLRNDKLAHVRALLEPDTFYHPAHQIIFQAMVDLDEKGSAVDPLTVTAEVMQREMLGRIEGGEGYLVDLLNEVPTAENIEHYANIVAERARRRRLVHAAREIAAKALGEEDDTNDLLDYAENAIFQIADRREMSKLITDDEAVRLAIKQIDERRNGKQIAGVKTGFKRLDRLLGGLQPSKLYLIGARPGLGKSGLALAIADNVAFGEPEADPPVLPVPVIVFSLEMTAIENAERLLGKRGRVDVSKLGGAEMGSHDWVNLTKAAGVYLDATKLRCKTTFDESPDINIHQIRATARRWAAEQEKIRREREAKGLPVSPFKGVIIVDYTQLVAPLPHEKGRRDMSRSQEISEVSRGLKNLAKQMGMPVVACAALNRDLEKRENKRPILSDLRECGQLEADANVVLFIYRDFEYDEEADPSIAEFILGKHRGGAKGTVRVRWLGEQITFEDFPEDDPRGQSKSGGGNGSGGNGHGGNGHSNGKNGNGKRHSLYTPPAPKAGDTEPPPHGDDEGKF